MTKLIHKYPTADVVQLHERPFVETYDNSDELREDAVASIEYFTRHLDDVGDGSGAKDINGDYSVTPKDFKFTPQTGKIYLLDKIVLTIRDVGDMDSALYGAVAALTDGNTFKFNRNAVLVRDFGNGLPFKTNGDLSDNADEYSITTLAVTDENIVRAVWNFPAPLVLENASVDELVFNASDLLTGLVHQFVTVYGREITLA